MKPSPRPCQQTNDPKRSFNCSHYDYCLTHAAKGRWEGFTCAACGMSEWPVHCLSEAEPASALETRRTSGDLHTFEKKAGKPAPPKTDGAMKP